MEKNFRSAQLKKNREFGFLVGGIFFALGVYGIFRQGIHTPWMAGLVGGGFMIVFGVFYPGLLYYPYQGWMFVGRKMGNIMSGIVLVLVFFFLFTPMAMIRRLKVRDPLKLRFDSKCDSYFIDKKIQLASQLERMF